MRRVQLMLTACAAAALMAPPVFAAEPQPGAAGGQPSTAQPQHGHRGGPAGQHSTSTQGAGHQGGGSHVGGSQGGGGQGGGGQGGGGQGGAGQGTHQLHGRPVLRHPQVQGHVGPTAPGGAATPNLQHRPAPHTIAPSGVAPAIQAPQHRRPTHPTAPPVVAPVPQPQQHRHAEHPRGAQFPHAGEWNRNMGHAERARAGQHWRDQHRGWDMNSPWRRDRNWWRHSHAFRLYAGPRIGFFFIPTYGYIAAPSQYANHHWVVGEYLPSWFWRYTVGDYEAYGLPPPPLGCAWVWVDNDVALVELDDGYIIDIVYNVW